MNLTDIAETGWIPDSLIRIGIRSLLAQRLAEIEALDRGSECQQQEAFRRELCAGPIAQATEAANAQHYEVPASFYQTVLGPRLKYSCGYWPEGVGTLAQAEECMLGLTAQRAGIKDGMRVLDLGCGWGSLSLWIAKRYPRCQIVAMSNSKSQREFILARCASRGLENVEVVTADINTFEPHGFFDRVVSVEMFEHVRNHALLMQRIARWLEPDGRLFVHIFSHRTVSYPYETEGAGNWMGRHFFTGGMMPSDNHLLHFQDHLVVERHWRLNGRHYQKTSEAWLQNLDRHRPTLLADFERELGPKEAQIALQRWRMFFMACAELFGSRNGREWRVSHYRFRPGAGQ